MHIRATNIKQILLIVLIGLFAALVPLILTSNPCIVLGSIVCLFMVILFFEYIPDILSRRFDVLEIRNIFLAFYTLYSLSVPMSYLLLNGYKEIEIYFIIKALFLCVLGLIFYIWGYRSKLPFKVMRYFNHDRIKTYYNNKTAKFCSNFLMLLGFFVFLAYLSKVGMRTYFEAGYLGRAYLKRVSGPLELGLYFIQVGIVINYVSAIKEKKIFYGSMGLIINIIVYVTFVFYIGIRRPIFGLLLSLICCYNYHWRRLNIAKSIIILFASGVVLILFAYVRHVNGLLNSAIFFIDNFSVNWLDISKTEFGAPFKSLLHVLSLEKLPLLMGSSYLESIFIIPPRSLNVFGFEPLSQWYTQMFFDNSFISSGGNMGFFLISELYINLRTIGVCMGMFTLGVLMRCTYLFFIKGHRKPYDIIVYSLIIPWIVFRLRLDFAVTLKSFIYTTFVPIIIHMIMMKYCNEVGRQKNNEVQEYI